MFITEAIEAKEEREVAIADIPNVFVQIDIPDGDEKVIMKMEGKLAEIMVRTSPEL